MSMGIDRYVSLAFPHKYSRFFSAKVSNYSSMQPEMPKENYPFTESKIRNSSLLLLNVARGWGFGSFDAAKKVQSVKNSRLPACLLFESVYKRISNLNESIQHLALCNAFISKPFSVQNLKSTKSFFYKNM